MRRAHRNFNEASVKAPAFLPDAVQDVASGEDAHVDVRHDDVVKVALALVGEEQVRHPHFARIRERQVFHATCERVRDNETLG